MTRKQTIRIGLAALLVFFCIQLFFVERGVSQTPSETSLKAEYRAAVEDAAIVDPEEAFNTLVSISPDNPWLVWNEDKTKVLVVTWKSQNSYDRFIKPLTNSSKDESRVIWVTASPQVKTLCQEYLQKHPNATEADLKLRLKQYLGLAPDWQYDVFVEMWVSPQDLFRPCVDPQIDDQQCNLVFDGATPDKIEGITPGSGIQNYRAFYKDLYFKSIRPDHLSQEFTVQQPWTGLGYTYDWGNPNSPLGASEFILIPGAAYTVQQAEPTLKYCKL
ncbi:MAG: hypothetical protein ICV68_18010 [Pyrinomonadaceae bacterium]|nr:hypothetical protein [Pyrinomonadaceae bacterium]